MTYYLRFIFSFCFFLSPCLLLQSADSSQAASSHKRILVGSPIRQKPAILKEFLTSLEELEQKGFTLDYYFVDDNELPASSELLNQFSKKQPETTRCYIFSTASADKDLQYVCNEMTHYWKEGLIWKVAAFKDRMIQDALDNKYDYLFLIDSDLVLHPETIQTLMASNKEIVSNIFWTSWTEGSSPLPQVWLTDHYTQYPIEIGEVLSSEEIGKRQQTFLAMLKQPGTYEVGGLGACTLISASALQKGVNFKKVKNITLWGEDRHFCVRAASLGVGLFVDTHHPAYHIYRESCLAGVSDFKMGKRIY